ncbi:MAG: putative baseplate assembly protein [Nocardioides sp.]|nr:putative baseplate assembly protein [Nocardioides sp.]
MSTATAKRILTMLGPSCRDNARRQLLLAQNVQNGVDYVEFEIVGPAPGTPTLHVHFLLNLPVNAFGLTTSSAAILVHGGERIVGVSVTSVVTTADSQVLDIVVDEQGDFSPYLLTLGWDQDDVGAWVFNFPGIDRLFSVSPINFRPGCPVDFDCATISDCDDEPLDEPALDYLARDYASFRQLLLDLVAQRNPSWVERSPADLGIALLELFAYEGDHLSYLQDAVANEAYLDTTRQRESAKRHAKLVDYQMHDGRNAWTYVHLGVGQAGTVPARTQLVTRITAALRFDRGPAPNPPLQPTTPPGPEVNVLSGLDSLGDFFDDYLADPALARVRVFETTDDTAVDPVNNEIRIHAWGNESCCLSAGTTTAHLYGVAPVAKKAVRPVVRAGDLILLEELLGPETGAAADADPEHRQVVRVTRVVPDLLTPPADPVATQMRDRLFLAALDADGEPKPAPGGTPVAQTLPLVEVTWQAVDALQFPLNLTVKLDDGSVVRRVSVARGNIVLADHGRTIVETQGFSPPFGGPRARLRLRQGPLTMRCVPPGPDQDVRTASPAVSIAVRRSAGPPPVEWSPVRDLLDSRAFDDHFVADVNEAGVATLRFGDGEYGPRLLDAEQVTATYRIGNGRDGNIGAEGLHHIVISTLPLGSPLVWPGPIATVRNPLPARDGADAETIEQTRQYAPAAFRATQLRAVTEDDYRRAALLVPGVAGAVARFRWTGSWHTVFVGIDPVDEADLVVDPRGHVTLGVELRERVLDQLNRYRLAGYDLEVRAARYVPLDLKLQLCVKPGYFRGDVARAVAQALSGTASGGPGLFDPSRLTFAQPVYLSRVYEAVEAVEGVDSAEVTVFHRHGREPAGELQLGVVTIGAWEVAQLANDPNRMESGTLTLTAAGGS